MNEIETVKNIKYLGILLDNKFSFQSHIDYLQSRLRAIIYQIFQLEKYANTNTLKKFYYAMVESILSYGIESWCCAVKTIEQQQEQIIKQILTHKIKKKLQTNAERYKYLQILPLEQLIYYKTMINNIIDTTYEEYKKNNLRSNETLQVPLVINGYTKKTLKYIIPTTFNKVKNIDLKKRKIRRNKKEIKSMVT